MAHSEGDRVPIVCHARCDCNYSLAHSDCNCNQMAETDASAALAAIIRREMPDARAVAAWTALLRAHATLMRALDSDLRTKTGSGLNDFDVLATLGGAGGTLRMADLAERAYSSRSGMTRRIDRLEEDGLVARVQTDQDGRGVVVMLTEAGTERMAELAAAHLRDVRNLFANRLEASELAALEALLKKVAVETSFG
jgi:DNA-binding MarR family transcriptional regulator